MVCSLLSRKVPASIVMFCLYKIIVRHNVRYSLYGLLYLRLTYFWVLPPMSGLFVYCHFTLATISVILSVLVSNLICSIVLPVMIWNYWHIYFIYFCVFSQLGESWCCMSFKYISLTGNVSFLHVLCIFFLKFLCKYFSSLVSCRESSKTYSESLMLIACCKLQQGS
jgi:hypothetical protein